MKKFDTGAIRQEIEDGRFDLLEYCHLKKMAITLDEGMIKYGKDNWKKGMPINEILNHAIIHIYKYLSGDRTEDHIGHAAVNLMFVTWFEENLKEIE